jgi:hypothetical protein
MQEPRAQRTLVKSPPELWAEVSDIDALARHLGEFGEIRITRLDPETTVAWEGDRACGTVALEPSGWGTKVTLTAKLAEEVAAEPVAAEPEPLAVDPEPVAPEPEAVEPEPLAAEPEPLAPEPEAVEPEPLAAEPEPLAPESEPDAAAPEHEVPPAEAPKVGFFARLFGRGRKVAPKDEPQAEAEPVVGEPLAAEQVAVEPEPEPVAEPVAVEPEPVAVEPEPVAIESEPVAVQPEPVAVEPEPVAAEPRPAPLDAERAEAILTGVLDDLGSAHHRPFSRT